MEPEPQWMTESQAAEYIGVSYGSLRNWRQAKKNGMPAFYKFGKKIKYKKTDLDDWIQSCRVDPGKDFEL